MDILDIHIVYTYHVEFSITWTFSIRISKTAQPSQQKHDHHKDNNNIKEYVWRISYSWFCFDQYKKQKSLNIWMAELIM